MRVLKLALHGDQTAITKEKDSNKCMTKLQFLISNKVKQKYSNSA